MTCRLGRTRQDLGHPQCRICQANGISCPLQTGKKKERRRYESFPAEVEGRTVLVVTFDLVSLNAHINKENGARLYRNAKRTWQRLLQPAAILFGPHRGRKRKVEIVRYVKSRLSFMDKTNREGAVKPIEDALVTMGVLADDSDEWMERPDVVQVVDPESRVEIWVG